MRRIGRLISVSQFAGVGRSRPPAFLQRGGRISGTRGETALGPAPTNERLSGRGETGWLARTQGGREPQRGSTPREDSRPTEDNARSGLKNGEPVFPDRLAWGLDTRKSPTAQDRSACLRLFETTSRRPVSPRAAPVAAVYSCRGAYAQCCRSRRGPGDRRRADDREQYRAGEGDGLQF